MNNQNSLGQSHDGEQMVAVSANYNHEDINKVKRSLETAVMLATMYREPVLIHYKDALGNTLIRERIIISATERYAMFKGGETIPLTHIVKVVS